MEHRVEVNTQYHDVAVLARKNYPIVAMDGVHLQGVVSMEYKRCDDFSDCSVVLVFGEEVEKNPFPYNDITVLQRLYSHPDNVSVRDILTGRLKDVH